MAQQRIRVLLVSDSEMLHATRAALSRKFGCDVVGIRSSDYLPGELSRFDVAVVCRSIPDERAESLTRRLRELNPLLRILRFDPRNITSDPFYLSDSEAQTGPEGLLKAVKGMLERSYGGTPLGGPKDRDEYCGPFAVFPLPKQEHCA